VLQPETKARANTTARIFKRSELGAGMVTVIEEGYKTGSFDILSAQSNKLAPLAQPL
jgi:hypothetical protein